MKVLKWITINEYVDGHTGEILNKKEVENKYIIIKKNKHVAIQQTYNFGTKSYEQWGYITYTNECTTRGKQLNIFDTLGR